MKKLFYILLFCCSSLMLPAAYSSDEPMPDAPTLGKRSREGTTRPDKGKRERTAESNIITVQSSIEHDPQELLSLDLNVAQRQSKTLAHSIKASQIQIKNIDPNVDLSISKIDPLIHRFSYDTQTLKNIISLLKEADDNPKNIDLTIDNIIKKRREIRDPFFWHKGQVYFTLSTIPELEQDPYIFALLAAADLFQVNTSIKEALIKYLFNQMEIPKDPQGIKALFEEFLGPRVTENYMPYIAKYYYLRFNQMPPEWKNITFELSVRELFTKPDGTLKTFLESMNLLNLNNKYLTSLDGLNKVFNIEDLTHIHLNNNRLKDLSELSILTQAPNLQLIDISNNNINSFKDMLSFPNLKHLFINNNNVNSWKYMPELPRLLYFDISHNQLNGFEHMPQLLSLGDFYITHNQLNDLEHMPQLPNLSNFNISHNQLNNLEHMPQLLNLKEFDISHNQLNNFEHMPQLFDLDTFDTSHNRLNSFEHMPQLPSLRDFNISHNQLNNFGHMPQLLDLDTFNISHNQLNSFEYMPQLARLRNFDISHNRLNSFGHMPQLTSLESFNISHNQLNDFEHMPILPNLKELNIRNTGIKISINELEKQYPELEILTSNE